MKRIQFSKQKSLALKGVAIVMMMFHHCFIPGRFAESIYNVNFWPLNANRVIRIALFFKICVSIFAFISGYGLMASFEKLYEKEQTINVNKWILKRLIKTLSGFWIVAVLSLIICQIINGQTYEVFFHNKNIIVGIVEILFNVFGLGYLLKVQLLNGTWWYMSIAVLFICSVPILYSLIKKYGYIFTALVLITVPRILQIPFSSESYFAFIFAVFLGMLCNDKNIIEKILNAKKYKKNKYINKIIRFLIGTVIIFVLYKMYYYLPLNKYWEINLALIPMMVIIYLCEFFIELPIISTVLQFLGKHSMNIFLIHTFIRTMYLTQYILLGKNFIVIAILLLLISLGLSVLLELLKKLVRYQNFIDYLQLKVDNYFNKYT